MGEDKFSYQNLRVYEDMIRAISLSEELASGWDRVHAIADHFCRASEGALVCLAEACRARQAASKAEAIGYSMGSVLECAGCFDIAACKLLCRQDESSQVKQRLCSVYRQLLALRRSWQAREAFEAREDSPEYGESHVFNHESLEAYQLALQVIRGMVSFRLLDRLPRTDFRRLDEAATSIVLNIAEGNGRFGHLDHSRFCEIANCSNTKLAARFEICALRKVIEPDEASEFYRLLLRIDRMTAKLADVWKNQEKVFIGEAREARDDNFVAQ